MFDGSVFSPSPGLVTFKIPLEVFFRLTTLDYDLSGALPGPLSPGWGSRGHAPQDGSTFTPCLAHAPVAPSDGVSSGQTLAGAHSLMTSPSCVCSGLCFRRAHRRAGTSEMSSKFRRRPSASTPLSPLAGIPSTSSPVQAPTKRTVVFTVPRRPPHSCSVCPASRSCSVGARLLLTSRSLPSAHGPDSRLSPQAPASLHACPAAGSSGLSAP